MAKAENILGDNQNFLQTADGTMARKGSVAALIATVNSIDSAMEKKFEILDLLHNSFPCPCPCPCPCPKKQEDSFS